MAKMENGADSGWRSHLEGRLPSLGHRNWIGVVDSAYPEQTAAGVEIVPTGEDHLQVVEAVLDAIHGSRHVRAVAFLDTELQYLEEKRAPGVDVLRAHLARLLEGQETRSEPHEALIGMLDEAGRQFSVLLLKSNLTLPYTSLFLRLECGYWDDEAEDALRQVMRKRLKDRVKEGK